MTHGTRCESRVYIIRTISEIMETLKCADNNAAKLMNELEDNSALSNANAKDWVSQIWSA
jgi:hypothetical protein